MRVSILTGLIAKNSRHGCPGLVAGIPLAFLLSAHPAAAADGPLFVPQVSFSTGYGPQSVAIGDLNDDGKPDLAVANEYGYTVSVLLGNGDGSFGPKTDYGAGYGPHSVAIGDLSGDGNPDLVVANASCFGSPGTISVLLGRGDGTFAASTAFEAGCVPFSVAIGDLNGDSKPDLAVANNGYSSESAGSVSVLSGNGDGTLGAKTDYRTGDYPNSPNSVAIGDLNNDGELDLAVANYGESTVSVLLGNGHGSFGVTDFGMGSYPYSLAIGDLNGDGRLDLTTANAGPGANSVSVVLGNGNGTFGVERDFGTGKHPYFVAIGDLNGDAKPDLVVANTGYEPDYVGSVSVLLGSGDGSFGGKTDYGAEAFSYSLAIGDLNEDGKPDLAIANNQSNTVSVLLNIGVTAVPPQRPIADLRFVGPSPNPARNGVNLVLELDRVVPVRVAVYDLVGHEVARPIADEHLSGRVSRAWRPQGLPSGVYYVRATFGGREQVRKLVWLGQRR